jgi:hypothetical protein
MGWEARTCRFDGLVGDVVVVVVTGWEEDGVSADADDESSSRAGVNAGADDACVFGILGSPDDPVYCCDVAVCGGNLRKKVRSRGGSVFASSIFCCVVAIAALVVETVKRMMRILPVPVLNNRSPWFWCWVVENSRNSRGEVQRFRGSEVEVEVESLRALANPAARGKEHAPPRPAS